MQKPAEVPYQHITKEERLKIEALISAGHKDIEIAKMLGRDRSSVGREIRRNGEKGKSYLARVADRASKSRKSTANTRPCRIVPGSDLEKHVVAGLKRYWSPEQVAGRLRRENGDKTVICHETIYEYIYEKRPDLKRFLRCRKGKYRRRYGTKIREKRREEARKKRIDSRPKIVETRKRIGDWEGDTIVGKEKTIHVLTHAERKSGYLLADKVDNATAERVGRITIERFRKLPRKKRFTITYDNGSQFAEYETTERDVGVAIYFAHPYHSWERGTNENTNGLLRQFIPKGTPFQGVSKRKLDRFVKLINTRPRKRHRYQTPEEVFKGHCCTSR